MTGDLHMPDAEVTLLDYWRVIWKYRRMVAWLFAASVLLALVVSLLLPKVYESSVTILPPADSGNQGAMAAAAATLGNAGLSGMNMGLPATSATTLDLFVAMLKSRTLGEMLVKRFDLVRVYDVDMEEKAVQTLESATKIVLLKEKVIKVTVEDRNPQLAADLANAYPSGLNDLNQRLVLTKAGQQRQFIEKRFTEAKSDLDSAEQALAAFQAQNKTVALDQQATAALKAGAEIQAQISATEVQLQVMQNFATPYNSDIIKLKLQLAELKQQLYTLESGKSGKGMLPGDRLHPAIITVPALGLEFTRLLREQKVQETVYTMLASQLEQAQIAEVRDTPTVHVLDPAKPAIRKIKPSIKLNMIVAGILSIVIGILVAFILENAERIRNQRKQTADSRP
jgi:tyrosine-protein kinase Etk/Wzc